jgi:hypothetical protein
LFFAVFAVFAVYFFSNLNREDLEDRKEDIFTGFVLIVHARSCAGFHP